MFIVKWYYGSRSILRAFICLILLGYVLLLVNVIALMIGNALKLPAFITFDNADDRMPSPDQISNANISCGKISVTTTTDEFLSMMDKFINQTLTNFSIGIPCSSIPDMEAECASIIHDLHFPKLDGSSFRCLLGKIRNYANSSTLKSTLFNSQTSMIPTVYPKNYHCLLNGYVTVTFAGGLGNQMYGNIIS